MAALRLSEDDVLNFLVSRGGEVPNADLRKHFRDFLESGDAEMRERSRQCFKQCVNAVATVTKTNGATCVRLRKRYAALLKGGTSGASGQRRSDRRSSQEQMNLQRQGQGDRMGSREGQGGDRYLEDRRSDEHYFIPGEEQSHHLSDSMGAGSTSSWASSPPGSLMSAQVGSYGEEERRGYYCAVGEGQVDVPEPEPVPSDVKPLDFSKGFGIVLVGSSLAEAAQQVGEWRIGDRDEQGGVSSHPVQAGSSTGASQFLRGDECRESAGLVSDERTGGFAPDTVSGLTDGWEPAVAAWEAQSKYSNSSDARHIHGEHWQVIPGAVGQSESNTDDSQSERVSLSSDQWAMPSHALEPQGRHVHVDQWHEIHGATGQMESSTEETSQWSRNTAIEGWHQREVLPFEYSHGDSVTHPHTDGHRDQMQLEQPYWEGQSLPEHIHRDGNRTLERPDTDMYISPGAYYNSSYGREEQSISERHRSDCWSTSGYYGPSVGVYDSGVEPGTQFQSHEREWSDNHDHVRESTRPYVEAAVGRLRTDVPRGGWEAAQDLYLNEPNPQGSQLSEENMYMTLETREGGGSVGQGAEYPHRAHDPPLHGAGWHHLQMEGERATMPDRSHERADDYLELERTDQWNKQYPQPGSEIPSITFTRDNDPQRGVAMTKVNLPAFVRVEPLPQSTSQSSRRSDSSQEWRESELDVRLSTPAESERRRSSAQHSQHDLNRNDYDEKMEVEKKHTVTRRVDILPETLADAQNSRRPDVNAPQGKLLPPPPLYAMMSRYLSSSELRSRGDPRFNTRENQPLPIATSSRSRSFPSLRFDIPPDATEDDLAEKEKRSMRESQNVTAAAGEQRPWFPHSSQSPRMHQDQFKQRDCDHRQEGSLHSFASSDRRQPSTTEVAARGIPMFIKHALTQGRRPRLRAKALMEKSHSLVNLQHENQWESMASYQQPADFLGATAEYPELFSEKSKSLRDLYEYSDEIGREGHPRDWNVVHANAREPLRETGRRAVLEKSKSLREFQSTDQPYSFQNQYRPDDHRFSLTDQTLINRSEDRDRLVLEKSRSLKDLYQSDQDFKFQDNHNYAGDRELKPARDHPSVPPARFVLPEKSLSLRDLHQNDNHFEHHREVRRNERDFHNPAVRTQSLGRDSHVLMESQAMGDIQSHHLERHQDKFHKRPDLGYTDTRPKVWTYPPLEDSESSLAGQDMFVPNLLPDREEVHPEYVSALVSCDDGAILDKLHPRRSTQSDVDNIPPLFAETMETVPTEPRAPSPALLTALPVTSEQLSGGDQALIERQQDHYDSEDDSALADNLRRVAAEIVHSPLRTRAQVTRAAWKQQQQQQSAPLPGEHSLAPSSSSSSAAPRSQDNDDDDPSYGSADEDFASNVRRVAKGLLAAQTGGDGQSRLSRQGSRMWKKPVAPVDWSLCVPQEVSRINEILSHSASRNNLRKQQQQLVVPQQDKVKKVAPVHLDTAPAVIEPGGPARETRVRERSRDRLQPETLSRVQRVWMLSAVRGDFRSLFRIMHTNPHLLLTKDLVSGFTALHWAAKHGDTNAVIILYQQMNKTRPPHAPGATGPGVEEPRSRVGHTPLHVAAMCGHKEVMRLLVNRFGAFVGARDAAGRRPGQYLPASSSSADIITLLDYRPGLARPVAAPSPTPLRAAKKTGVGLASSQSMSRKSVMSVMFGHGSEDGHSVKPGRPKSSYLS
ncbi:uncharacterized protein LOC116957833 isoform X2 [Petromyzon marinus]|uniref:uncharacterized protein LOC116957833 isoform X2 n=1 Tax=Petromyzon marinus TaxID=7757 RepID=UPI003F710DEE